MGFNERLDNLLNELQDPSDEFKISFKKRFDDFLATRYPEEYQKRFINNLLRLNFESVSYNSNTIKENKTEEQPIATSGSYRIRSNRHNVFNGSEVYEKEIA